MADQTNEDDEDDEEYEIERVMTRAEGASTLRQLATGVETGSVTLASETVVTVPEQFELEIEYEQEDDEAELEVELEWPVDDGEAVAVEPESEAVDAEVAVFAGDADSVDRIEMTETESKATFELFEDRANEWRWRLVHDNGNIIADSGEGYSRKANARKGLESVMRNASGASVVEQTD